MRNNLKRLLFIFAILFSASLSVFGQVSIKPSDYDLVLKVGQEFKPGEVSLFVDDIEVIKKDKFSKIVELSNDQKNHYIVIAEQSDKKDHPIYCKYNLLWISEFKYNGKSYQPIMVIQNHFYLKAI